MLGIRKVILIFNNKREIISGKTEKEILDKAQSEAKKLDACGDMFDLQSHYLGVASPNDVQITKYFKKIMQ